MAHDPNHDPNHDPPDDLHHEPPLDLHDLLADLDTRIRRLETLPDEIQDEVFTVLQRIDRLHRSGLERIGDHLKAAGLWEALIEDEVVNVLFTLYDLIPLEDGAPAEGWIELPMTAPGPARSGGPQVVEVARLSALPTDRVTVVGLEGREILLVRAGRDAHAYAPTCPGCGLSLEGATLSGHVLVCPWQNCAYDLRSGRRVDGEPGGHLRAYPVIVQGDGVLLATDFSSTPRSSGLRSEGGG